jgi:hypothetical protein
MKTAKNTGLGVILVLLVCFTVICGCKEKEADNSLGNGGNDLEITRELGTFPGLDAETEKRILQAVANQYDIKADELYHHRIQQHIIVNDCIVVSLNGFPQPGISSSTLVGGVLFNAMQPIVVWKDGCLYDLQDAYDLGHLPKETFEGLSLSAETEKQIKRAYLDTYLKPVLPSDPALPSYVHPDNVHIAIMRHTVVDGCDVVLLFDGGFLLSDNPNPYAPLTSVDIGGVLFDTRLTFVWKDGSLYDLQDAYDLGSLQKKD